jgi:hypothetical protein
MSIRSLQSSIDVAKSRWPLTSSQIAQMSSICRKFGLAVCSGDVTLIDGKWYVTHAGLLGLATRRRCVGIWTRPLRAFCRAENRCWVFKATVFTTPKCKGFDGYGDACPENVSDLVRGAELRVAETRAVNRALRKAYGIGLCSVEEIGSTESSEVRPGPVLVKCSSQTATANSPYKHKLFELIRRHQLDGKLVQSYAKDFCGIGDLRHADREAVARFVENLSNWATRDRTGLVEHLERYEREKRSSK